MFLFFPQETGLTFQANFSIRNNLHEMSNPVFFCFVFLKNKKKKMFRMSTAENFTQSAKL